MSKKDPWQKTWRRIGYVLIVIGWLMFAGAVYQASQFDYELANFDPYEILQVFVNDSPMKQTRFTNLGYFAGQLRR